LLKVVYGEVIKQVKGMYHVLLRRKNNSEVDFRQNLENVI